MQNVPEGVDPKWWQPCQADAEGYTRSTRHNAQLVIKYYRVHGALYKMFRLAYGITERGQVFLRSDYPANKGAIASMLRGFSPDEAGMNVPGALIRPTVSGRSSPFYQIGVKRFGLSPSYVRIPAPMLGVLVSGHLRRWNVQRVIVPTSAKQEMGTFLYNTRPEVLRMEVDEATRMAFEDQAIEWNLSQYQIASTFGEGLDRATGNAG